ncbi:MAG: hypothetical protein XD95_0684, partial [Microgenomates bacterium 39_7]
KYTDSRCTNSDGYSELSTFDAAVNTSWNQKIQTGTALGSSTRGISIQVYNYYPNVNATFYFDRFVVRESAYNSTDLAEMVPANDENINQADIVAIDKNTGKIKLADQPYDQALFGIVATQPGIILQNENEEGPRATVALAGRVPIKVSANNGPIQPGDPITSSDIPGVGIRASQAGTIVGNAMEGTENWDETTCSAVSSLENINWPEDDGLNSKKPCYKLPDGTYVGKIMAFVNTSWSDSQVYLTDGGDIRLIGETTEETKTYQVKDKNNNLINRVGAFSEVVAGKIRSGLIETTSLIADTATARQVKTEKLLSPIIETEEITVKRGLKSATAEIGTVTSKQANFENLTSASAEVDSLTAATAEIGQINAQGASFGDLLAQNVGIGQLEAESVKTEKLDVAQDATIAGTLYVDRVVARDGGFGELLAKDISMDSIRAIVREEIEIAKETEDTNVDTNDTENTDNTNINTNDTDEEVDIESLLAEVEGWLNLNTDSDLTVDETLLLQPADQGDEGENGNQITAFTDNFIHQGDLTILGQTTTNSALITGQLAVGDLTLADNSISNLNGSLYLQKEGLGGLDVLNGKFMIDTEGNVFIAQHLTVSGDLMAGNIKPKEGEDLVLDLVNSVGQGDEILRSAQDDGGGSQDDGEGSQNDDSSSSSHSEGTPEESGDPSRTGSFADAQDDGGGSQDDGGGSQDNNGSGFGKLLVKGINEETVVQIDASGSAQFAGTVRADSLAISKPENNQENIVIAASENFDQINIWAPGITSNASAGQAALPVGQTDLIIYNDRLTNESMVYLTPTSDTQNQVLYVKAKVAQNDAEKESQKNAEIDSGSEFGMTSQNYFVVGINQPINEEVKFNWWIIN